MLNNLSGEIAQFPENKPNQLFKKIKIDYKKAILFILLQIVLQKI